MVIWAYAFHFSSGSILPPSPAPICLSHLYRKTYSFVYDVHLGRIQWSQTVFFAFRHLETIQYPLLRAVVHLHSRTIRSLLRSRRLVIPWKRIIAGRITITSPCGSEPADPRLLIPRRICLIRPSRLTIGFAFARLVRRPLLRHRSYLSHSSDDGWSVGSGRRSEPGARLGSTEVTFEQRLE